MPVKIDSFGFAVCERCRYRGMIPRAENAPAGAGGGGVSPAAAGCCWEALKHPIGPKSAAGTNSASNNPRITLRIVKR